MKKLRSIIQKSQERHGSGAYVADSCSKKRNLQGIAFYNIKWRSFDHNSCLTTLEQELLIPNNASLYFQGDVIDVDDEPSKQKSKRICLIFYQAHYYLIQFDGTIDQLARFKKFTKRNFHLLMGMVDLKQYNMPIELFFEGPSHYRLNLNLIITLISRYDSSVMPFLSFEAKDHALKSISDFNEADSKGNFAKELLNSKQFNSKNKTMDKRERINKLTQLCFQAFIQESKLARLIDIKNQKLKSQETGLLSTRPASHTTIQITSDMEQQTKIKPIKQDITLSKQESVKEVEIQVSDELSQKKADDKREEDANNYPKMKNEDDHQNKKGSYSANTKKFARLTTRQKLPIVGHLIDETDNWVYLLQKTGTTYCVSEDQMVICGYADEIAQYRIRGMPQKVLMKEEEKEV